MASNPIISSMVLRVNLKQNGNSHSDRFIKLRHITKSMGKKIIDMHKCMESGAQHKQSVIITA